MMNNIFSRMTLVALALWLGLAAGAANAVTAVTAVTEVTLSGSYTAGYAGTFSQVVNGAFNNVFSFMMPTETSGNGAANSIALGNDGSFSYTAFNLYSDLALTTKIATGVISSLGSFDFASLSFSNLLSPATYYLNVIGSTSANSASYSGNINISPVPEPETYAMMLAGLGLLGFSARRRKNTTFD